ncbi:31391_t:CDS:2, partial [Racocetra persica]
HLMRESQFVRFNKINRELPRVMHATYQDHYFMAIDEACTKFLIPAIQKLQRNQMDQCPHYRAYRTDLEFELQQQAHVENIDKPNTPKGMFSEDLYDETLIELTKLVDGIGDIKKLWIVSRIDQQKHHFVVLFRNATILKNDDYSNERAISIRSGRKFGAFENDVQVDFSLIDLIRSQYIFTPKIQHHIRSCALYGKGFGLMKRTLNLAIQTEPEQEGRVLQSDDEYNYEIINNLLKPQTKGRKHQKRIAAFNDSARKKVLKKTTNVLQNDDLVRMASSNISNESINVDSTEGTEEQDQMMHEHIQDVQGQDQRTKVDMVNEDMEQSIQGKKKHAYTCENCGKDGHRRSHCPN